MQIQKTKVFRVIIPAFPFAGIFTRFHNRITALGPVVIATVVHKFLPTWRAEVIDENNYCGPRTNAGHVDHAALQNDNPADAVGLYCGLSSPMLRAWQIAAMYKELGVPSIAGGRHVSFAPDESRGKFDTVIIGEAENAILEALQKLDNSALPPILSGKPPELEYVPFPDFGLLRFIKKLKIHPIGRIRGCGKRCEFCTVNEKPRWASPERLFQTVCHLNETRKAKNFFIVDDRLEEDREGYLQFFRMVQERFGKRLKFTVQVRLAACTDSELLRAMQDAGVKTVCIGFESPIDEELRVMRKGITVARMLKYTDIWVKRFNVHGMFIFGYPLPDTVKTISFQERIKRFKRFIKKSGIYTVQVMHPIPLVGSKLRQRLEESEQLFPLEAVNWNRYSGDFICFQPKDMTLEQLQKGPTKIMLWFYSWHAWYRIPFKTIAMPFHYLIAGWHRWYRGWRSDVIKAGAYILLRKHRQEEDAFIASLKK